VPRRGHIGRRWQNLRKRRHERAGR
jgi:hypothetical protein